MKKLSRAISVLLVMLFILAGCASNSTPAEDKPEEPEQQEVQEEVKEEPADDDLVAYNNGTGLTIKMPAGMVEDELEGYTMFYYCDDFMFETLRESFEDLEEAGVGSGDTTVDEYKDIIVSNNGVEFDKDLNGNYYAVYESNVDGNDFTYMTTILKGSEAFYMATFACLKETSGKYLPLFADYSLTATVD